jgi:hypothetical protein
MQPILGFLPQHVWEVGAGVLALTFLWQGGLLLVRGRAASLERASARIAGLVVFAFGVGIGIAAVFVDSESSAVESRDKWGGVGGIVGLIIWLILLAVSTSIEVRRRR